MRFQTLGLVVVFLAVVSAVPQYNQQSSLPEDSKKTTENGQSTPSPSTEDEVVLANNGLPNEITNEKLQEREGNILDPDLDDMLIFESLMADDKGMEENEKSENDKNEKSDYALSNSENPVESKVSSDFHEIRRQGDLIPESKEENSASRTQFDDSKQRQASRSEPPFGQRRSKQKAISNDGAPLLELTQGGYGRPYKRSRSRNRYASRQDSSEQSSRAQEPDGSSENNENLKTRQVVPQVTYSSRLQGPPQALGPRDGFNSGYETPNRNALAFQHVVPTTIPSRFFNTPAVFPDYTAAQFQAQFPPNNDVGVYSNFVRDPNNVALYQDPQGNPFQVPQLLYQNNPEGQTQSYVMEPPRTIQPQFQQNPFNARGFENGADNARPNYPAYFSNPTQFQIPPNFYSTPPNGVGAFNSPPISFLSNYPNADNTLSPRPFRYPLTTTDPQNNQQNVKDQQLDSEASQEEKNSKAVGQETVYPKNRDDSTSVRFGTRLQAQNEDVYMRYPTDEAGYATRENLPPQNNSEEAKDNSQQTSSEQRNIQTSDSSRNGLNSARTNQRINNSFGFPPELFRDAPLDFGYKRPQNQILYSDRNRGSPNFESRNFFNPLESFPENNYQFLNSNDQRRGHRDSDGTPSCAKQSNASYCFEDKEYPSNDVLYSVNSNSFLADRLAGLEVPLDSVSLVERNATEIDEGAENYACSADVKYGSLLRAQNLAGSWRVVVNVKGKISQPVRMEMCKSLGNPCNYITSSIKSTCVQKYSVSRLLTWSPGKGIYSDLYKIPVACSCQILEGTKA